MNKGNLKPLHTRLSGQQRMILAILRKKGKGWVYFDTVRDGLLKAKGLDYETKSFRASLSRTIKNMKVKGFITLIYGQWIFSYCGTTPIWRFARLTRFGLWLAELLNTDDLQRPELQQER